MKPLLDLYREVSQDPRANVLAFVKVMATRFDALEKDVQALGGPSTKPDPMNGPNWEEAMTRVSGYGDVFGRMRDMCAKIDELSEWLADQKAQRPNTDMEDSGVRVAEVPSVGIAEVRRPRGRPRKDAQQPAA